jgi:transposase-like protein
VEYNEKFKRKMVQRLLGPDAKSAAALSKEVNVHPGTLSRWLREASTVASMVADKPTAPGPTKVSRSAEDKLRIVLAVEKCSPSEEGALLRQEGVHEAELLRWREAMTAALEDGRGETATGKSAGQSKRIRLLERELNRKNRALAEAAALLVLQKKVRSIWGDEDDDMVETTDT